MALWPGSVLLAVLATSWSCGAAAVDKSSTPYEELVAQRFSFSDDYNFPLVPFRGIRSVARLAELMGVILTEEGELYSVDGNATTVGDMDMVDPDTIFSALSVDGLGQRSLACAASVHGWGEQGFMAAATDGTAWAIQCSGQTCQASIIAGGAVLGGPEEGTANGKHPVSCAAAMDSTGRMVAAIGGIGGLWSNIQDAATMTKEDSVVGVAVRSVAIHIDDLDILMAAATEMNVFLGAGALGNELLSWRREWSTAVVPEAGGGVDSPGAHLAFDPTGDELWVGGLLGLQAWDTNYRVFHRMQGLADGLPLSTVTHVAAASGTVWVGTTRGLARRINPKSVPDSNVHSKGEWRYLYGPRWLPGTTVRDMALLGSGSHSSEASGCDYEGQVLGAAVVVSDGGVAVVRQECWTLDLKAKHYQSMVHPRHDRYGYVSECSLSSPGDLSTYQLSDSDNDGLWTAMYTAAQVFRAAVSETAEDRAGAFREVSEHSKALLFLFDVTGTPGYMARSVVLSNESHATDKTWYNSTTAPGWIYKGDTSSDEVVGHMFYLPLAFSLLGDDPAARPLVAEAKLKVSQLMSRVLAHGMTLVDPETGEPTTWGHWEPSTINDKHDFADNRGLNSLEIISFLRNAEVITGDAVFGAAAEKLKQEFGYGDNILNAKITVPFDINFSDDELAFLPYYSHLVTADAGSLDPEVVCSLSRSWREGVSLERSALWATIHAAVASKIDSDPALVRAWRACGAGSLTTEAEDVATALWSLRNWPLELITWPVTNSGRQDIVVNPNVDRFGHVQSMEVLPANERNQYRWNSNPHELDSGWPGASSEGDPGAWLLAFWMAKFHGLI